MDPLQYQRMVKIEVQNTTLLSVLGIHVLGLFLWSSADLTSGLISYCPLHFSGFNYNRIRIWHVYIIRCLFSMSRSNTIKSQLYSFSVFNMKFAHYTRMKNYALQPRFHVILCLFLSSEKLRYLSLSKQKNAFSHPRENRARSLDPLVYSWLRNRGSGCSLSKWDKNM